jgi:tetratricopeptide (TPR) repeat protein
VSRRTLIVTVFLFVTSLAGAQENRLALSGKVVTEDLATRRRIGVDDIRIVVFKSGEDVTKNGGFFSVPLGDNVQAGDQVSVTLSPPIWILNNYFDGRIIVPKKDTLELLVEKKGSPRLLTNNRIRYTLEKTPSGQIPTTTGTIATVTREPLNDSIASEAAKLGISPGDFTAAIERWITDESSRTEHDKALADFYRRDFAAAVEKISSSIQKQEASLTESYVLLGNAQLNLINLKQAAAAYRKALGQDSNSADALAGLTATCTLALAVAQISDSILQDGDLMQCESHTVEIARHAIATGRLGPTRGVQSIVHTLTVVSSLFWVDAVTGRPIFEEEGGGAGRDQLAAELRSAANAVLSDVQDTSGKERLDQVTRLAFVLASMVASRIDTDPRLALKCISNALEAGEKAYGAEYPLRPVLTALSSVDPKLSNPERYKLYEAAVQSSVAQRLFAQAAFLEWLFAEVLVHDGLSAESRAHYKRSIELWNQAGTRQRIEPIITRIRYGMTMKSPKAMLKEFDTALLAAEAMLPPNHIVIVKLRKAIQRMREEANSSK